MDTNQWLTQLSEIFSADLDPVVYFQALIIIIIGFVLARVASLALRRAFRESASPHVAVLTQRAAFYLILSLSVITALHQLGFNFGVLLGAAGILTIAVGFASQTSMSNLISGLFLIGERPFAIGDLIKIGDTVGEVLSIDLLSVKLRLFDNTYVRIPNETIIKSEVSTLTKFPIRRIDLKIGVAFKEDIARVRQVLLDVADKNPLCLEEPSPLFLFQGFGDSSINLQFSIWVKTEEYLTLRNNIQLEIKAAFDLERIEIPFPHRTLYTSSKTEPFPVTIVTKAAG